MGSSKSYDLYLGLGLFVILFSQAFSHTLPQPEATNPGRKMALDGRVSMEDIMRAVYFLQSRSMSTKGNMDTAPRLTEPKTGKERNIVDVKASERNVDVKAPERNVDVKAPEGDGRRTFPAAAYPWMKNDNNNNGAKAKSVIPGTGNRRLLENFGTKEEEIEVLQLSNSN